MKIAIDFDGTIVENRFPSIGPPVPMAIETILELQTMGHDLILWTVRTGIKLTDALLYCQDNKIKFYGVNKNPSQFKSTSSKVYCDIIIDDKAIGCPIIKKSGMKPYVDWIKIRSILLPSECDVSININKTAAGPKGYCWYVC